jgi:cytochrome P450 family 110
MTALLPTIDTPSPIQLWQWITEPLKYLHDCDRQCGDMFAVSMTGAFKGAVFLSDPQAIQQLLTRDTKQFAAPGSIDRILKPF